MFDIVLEDLIFKELSDVVFKKMEKFLKMIMKAVGPPENITIRFLPSRRVIHCANGYGGNRPGWLERRRK